MTLRPTTTVRRQANTASTHSNYLFTEPKTTQQARTVPEWCVAMAAKIQALVQNHTWRLVPRPQHKNVIGNKWVFRIKRKPDGSVDCYKARLVAKGFAQQSRD
jgi:hypothetical protein